MLELNYNAGHGRMVVDLDQLLPCSKANFKRLTDTIDLTNDPESNAKKVYDHIASRIVDLKKERKTWSPSSESGKKEISRINVELKKFLGLSDVLVKRYSFEPIEDGESRTTLKAATVYSIIETESGENAIEVHSGWTFEKAGYRFDVYKRTFSRRNRYIILLHGTGRSIAESSTKNGIVTEITPRVLEILANMADKIADYKSFFNNCMNNAGYTSDTDDKETSNETNNEKENETMKNETTKNTNYFEGVKTLEDLRIRYLELLKANHPDNGGDVEIMQNINAAYDTAREMLKNGVTIENEKDAAKWSDVEDEALRAALYKVVFLHGLNIEIVGCWIWIDGETFTNREALKEAGYKWSRTRQKWHFAPYESKWHKGSKKSFDQLRRTYGSEKVENEERHEIA